MKKYLSLILIIAFIFCVGTIVVSCDSQTKTTPVYEGMTIASSYTAMARESDDLATVSGNENHNFVNEDEKEDVKPVDEVVTITVEGSSEVEYFVRPGEVFTVQVHLSNPDNFEIQSFTLNGEKYASYMFKDGSDMELLLLEVTAPSEAGYFELTIDAIKYIDGTDIKDVRMDGEKTLKAAVSYLNAPKAKVSDLKISQNNASMKVNVDDEYGLTNANGIKIYLTDGEKVVEEKNLEAGENTVSFEGLAMDVTYGYGIATSCDMLDGKGTVVLWLAKGTFTTGKAFYITSVTAGQDYVNFTYEKGIDSGVITAIKLLDSQNNELDVLQGEGTTFEGLLSGSAYKIRLEFTYTFGGESKSGASTVSFSTVAKTVPVVKIENVSSTRTDISFDIKTTDNDGILSLDKVVLLNGNVEIKQFSEGEDYSVSGLDAGTLYTIRADYSYDLNDGNGMCKQTVSVDYPTLAASIAIEDIALLNTNVVKIGEELNMRIYFNNSSEIEMTDIYVNGIKVQVVGGDKKTSAIVKFIPEETGLIDFTVDKVEYVFYDIKVSQNIDSDVSVTYPIYGDLEGVAFEAISASPYEYTGSGVYFSFDNKDGYEVYKINDSDSFVEIDSGEYYVDADSIESVEYGYDNYGHTTQLLDYREEKHSVGGFSTVSTPEELLAMTNGYYVLTQDIDMRNFSLQTKINLTGILDGAGHTIRGLTRVIDTSKTVYFDVFDEGSVYDLKFTELYANVDNSKSNSQIGVSVLGNVKLYNCSVMGDVIASNARYIDLNVQRNSVTYTINKTVNGINSVDKVASADIIAKDTAVSYEDGAIIFTMSDGNKYFVGYYGNTMTEFDASLYFAVEENAFASCDSLTSFRIPEGVFVNGLDLEGCDIISAEYGLDNNVRFDKSQLQTLILRGESSIGVYAFQNCSSLTHLIILDSITSIGDYAFRGCSSLKSVTFGENSSLESIGSNAFYNCSSLESITIPDSVTSIGDYAFYYCSSLTSITIPDCVTSIGDYAFYNCSLLESVTFGENSSLESIGFFAFSECSSLTSITIPDCVTSIGDYAFYNCSSLTSITIPDSVTSIGDYAFYNCSLLTNITIPESVTSIGSSAFAQCNITAANIPANAISYISKDMLQTVIINSGTSIDKEAFRGCSSLASITIPDSVTSIGDYAFYYCSLLESVTFGENSSLESIGSSAFYNCSSLKSVTFGENSLLESIGSDAFYNCSSLTSITIPDGVTSIGDYAFRECSSLKSVTFGENSSLESIGSDAFYGCSSLTSITIPDSVTSIGDYAFYYCSSLTSITIPGNVTSIGNEAFYNCSSLESVTFGENSLLESIGSDAFYGCSSLTSITIPDGVTSIGDYAFYNCSSLEAVYITDIEAWCNILFSSYDSNPLCYAQNLYLNGELVTELEIPESVTSIGDYAFSGCSSLESVTFGENSLLESIGSDAFYGCSSLTRITIPDGVTSIGSDAFSRCSSLTRITIPDGVTSIGEYAFFECGSLESVTFGENSSLESIGSGAFYNCSSLEAVYITDIEAWCNILFSSYDSNPLCYAQNLYLNGELVTELEIPESVTSIGDYAFSGCSSLTSITIPDSVTSIGDYAFIGCSSLKSVTFGENSLLESIGSNAFYNCSSLTSITIPDSVTSIGNEAFYNCSSLESITIPDSVTSIGNEAFYNCSSLESITIPDSVTSIGDYAFYYCSLLESVYYLGSEQQWSQIEIDDSNSKLLNAKRYYYSESEPSLNEDGTAYNGDYWRYVDGVPTPWVKEA